MQLEATMRNAAAVAGEYGWALQAFAIVLATLVIAAVARRILGRLHKQTQKTSMMMDDALFAALLGPTRGLIWIIGISAAAQVVGARTESVIFEALPTLREIGIVAMMTWFLVRFARNYEDSYVAQRAAKGEPVDWTFVRALGKLVRAAMFITAGLIILQSFGVNIAGLLAFGGMGGIAVGLAARDLLANVFGGLTIYMDRPFAVGDWIRSPDQEIEGTVEEIGWRRTTIRTFDMRPLYVPNALFTTISVENPSRMLNRRIYETIGVRYCDVSVLPAILEDVRSYLNKSAEIDTSRTLMVNFNAFGASSLDFFVYCFTRTVVWTEYHAVKERVLLGISDIIARHGGEVAFPTRTLHVADPVMIAQAAADKPALATAAAR